MQEAWWRCLTAAAAAVSTYQAGPCDSNPPKEKASPVDFESLLPQSQYWRPMLSAPPGRGIRKQLFQLLSFSHWDLSPTKLQVRISCGGRKRWIGNREVESQNKIILARGNSNYINKPIPASCHCLPGSRWNPQLTLLVLRVFPQEDFLVFLCNKDPWRICSASLLDVLL